MATDKNNRDSLVLQHGLAQILRNYAGAGVKRFSQATELTLSANDLAQFALQQLSSGEGADSRFADPVTPSVSAPLTSLSTTGQSTSTSSQSQQTRGQRPLPLAPAPGSSPEIVSAELTAFNRGTWQLHGLALEDRVATLAQLDAEVKGCRKCEELVCYRRQTVFGEGNLKPRVVFFGEAPGADEDAQGRPFVGAAGGLLSEIIRAMRLTRDEVYILNALKCRPPQNRTPLSEEVDNCRPYALTQLETLQPEFIILLGAVAVRSVLQSSDSVGRLRGRFHHFHGARVLVTYHPAYLLRTPEAKKLVWTDVQMVMHALAGASS